MTRRLLPVLTAAGLLVLAGSAAAQAGALAAAPAVWSAGVLTYDGDGSMPGMDTDAGSDPTPGMSHGSGDPMPGMTHGGSGSMPGTDMPGTDMPGMDMPATGDVPGGASSRPRALVLGVFAFVNIAVLMAAAVLRRRTAADRDRRRAARVAALSTR